MQYIYILLHYNTNEILKKPPVSEFNIIINNIHILMHIVNELAPWNIRLYLRKQATINIQS